VSLSWQPLDLSLMDQIHISGIHGIFSILSLWCSQYDIDLLTLQIVSLAASGVDLKFIKALRMLRVLRPLRMISRNEGLKVRDIYLFSLRLLSNL
jgi:hypothetical protein